MKTLGTSAASAWLDPEKRACAFVQLEFTSGTQRYTTLPYDTSWNGNTWIGVGRLAEISEIRESEALVATGVQITLSGLPASLVSLALAENVQGRTCTIWFAALGADSAVLDTPPVEFKGKVDTVPIQLDDGTARIVVNVESVLADFARPKVRRFTDADQQAVYPGDRFFEFVPQMVEKEIIWPARSWFLR